MRRPSACASSMTCLHTAARPRVLVARLDVSREHARAERFEPGCCLRELILLAPAAEVEPRVTLHAVGEEPIRKRPRPHRRFRLLRPQIVAAVHADAPRSSRR